LTFGHHDWLAIGEFRQLLRCWLPRREAVCLTLRRLSQ
jgi:hypothetical protein